MAAAAVTASVAAATVMAEPIHQMEEEVESIVEKHQLEEMERASVAPKDTEEDDIEPELQRIKVGTKIHFHKNIHSSKTRPGRNLNTSLPPLILQTI